MNILKIFAVLLSIVLCNTPCWADDPAPDCSLYSGAVLDEGTNTCVCDTANSYYGNDVENCVQCLEHQTWDDVEHECKDDDGWDCSEDSICKCAKGYKKDGENCTICPAGQYSDSLDSSACTKCSPGTYAAGEGATSSEQCVKCSAGTHALLSGSTTCEDCPEGQYQDKEGKSSCNFCPTGTTTASTGSDSASACTPVNKFGYGDSTSWSWPATGLTVGSLQNVH